MEKHHFTAQVVDPVSQALGKPLEENAYQPGLGGGAAMEMQD